MYEIIRVKKGQKRVKKGPFLTLFWPFFDPFLTLFCHFYGFLDFIHSTINCKFHKKVVFSTFKNREKSKSENFVFFSWTNHQWLPPKRCQKKGEKRVFWPQKGSISGKKSKNRIENSRPFGLSFFAKKISDFLTLGRHFWTLFWPLFWHVFIQNHLPE